MELTHIDGPTTLIAAYGMRILTDPTFDPPGGTYPLGERVLEKTGTPARAVHDIEPIDVVLLSHDEHADNLDAAGRALLDRVPLVLTTVTGALRLGGNARGLQPWETVRVPGPRGEVRVTAVAGRHGPPGIEAVLGDVIGFFIEWDGQGNGGLYVSGDTVWYDGPAQLGARATTGTAIVHLGRVAAPDGTTFTMSAHDIPAVVRDLNVRTVVPVHVEGWKHFTESRAAASRIVEETGMSARVRWIEPGIPTAFPD